MDSRRKCFIIEFSRYCWCVGGFETQKRPNKQLPFDLKQFQAKIPDLGRSVCAIIEFESAQAAKFAVETLKFRTQELKFRLALLEPGVSHHFFIAWVEKLVRRIFSKNVILWCFWHKNTDSTIFFEFHIVLRGRFWRNLFFWLASIARKNDITLSTFWFVYWLANRIRLKRFLEKNSLAYSYQRDICTYLVRFHILGLGGRSFGLSVSSVSGFIGQIVGQIIGKIIFMIIFVNFIFVGVEMEISLAVIIWSYGY